MTTINVTDQWEQGPTRFVIVGKGGGQSLYLMFKNEAEFCDPMNRQAVTAFIEEARVFTDMVVVSRWLKHFEKFINQTIFGVPKSSQWQVSVQALP